MITALALVAVGFAAGVVNTMAGAGSLLVLPVLLLMGVDAHLANGTNRVGVVVQAAAATWGFWGQGQRGVALPAAAWAPAAVGGVLGAFASLIVSAATLERVVVLSLLGVPLMLWPPATARGEAPRWVTGLAFFAVGLWGGFLQAGVGFLLLGAQVRLLGRDVGAATAGKVVLTGVFNVPALLIFVANGEVDLGKGAALAVGGGLGGRAGAWLAARGGDGPVRAAVIVAAAVMGGRLVGWW